MILQTVTSTAIHAIGYDIDRRAMEIIFTGGGIYLYQNVPLWLFKEFMHSDSKGTFFLTKIRGHFPHHRLGRWRPRRGFRRRAAAA